MRNHVSTFSWSSGSFFSFCLIFFCFSGSHCLFLLAAVSDSVICILILFSIFSILSPLTEATEESEPVEEPLNYSKCGCVGREFFCMRPLPRNTSPSPMLTPPIGCLRKKRLKTISKIFDQKYSIGL